MALGDRVQLQQVVMNLLANAAEATSERGDSSRHISLRASAAGDRVVFEVRDTGCGVAPSDAARIFEPFFSTKADGMGIGLSICKTIVERHGGDLSVRANEDGDGSTFWFTVPVAAASDAAAAAADTHAR